MHITAVRYETYAAAGQAPPGHGGHAVLLEENLRPA
jgi:hypothetical protein